MRKILGLSILAISMTGMSNAFAHGHGNAACKPVKEACEKAGKAGKDAWACVKTIKGGGTVAGVTVSEADANACKAGPAK